MAESFVYIGSYTEQLSFVAGLGKGISCFKFDEETAVLTPLSNTAVTKNPSYLAVDQNGRFLYAVQEMGAGDAAVFSYQIDPKRGELTYLNQQAASDAPCHVVLDPTQQFVLVANYSSGETAVYPRNEDGTLQPPSDVIQHQGSGSNASRQEGPHAHMICFRPHSNTFFVADLGLDAVLAYALEAGKAVPRPALRLDVPAGAGPRHLAFHPSGAFAFVLNELDSTLSFFEFTTDGVQRLGTRSTIPDEFDGNTSCAAIRLSANGRFIYASNRGHDSIAVFSFDEVAKTLTAQGWQETFGKAPRDFCLSKNGRFLLAANQDSHTLVRFSVDDKTGTLTKIGEIVEIGNPVAICFLPAVNQ